VLAPLTNLLLNDGCVTHGIKVHYRTVTVKENTDVANVTYEVFVPVLPGLALSPNSRSHWRRKMAATKELRGYVSTFILADVRQQKWPGLPMQRAQITFEYRVCRKREGPDGYARPRDPDNAQAALKGLIDGVVDAGIVIGDTGQQLTIRGTTIKEVESRQEEGIAIAVEEISTE
jgi:hypothetical protein